MIIVVQASRTLKEGSAFDKFIEVFNQERPHEALDTKCGRICLGRKKISFSTAFAGLAVGIKEVQDDIWLVSSMDYDLGYFDLETRVLEPFENPFGPKVLPMSPVRTVTHVSGLDPRMMAEEEGFEPPRPFRA